MVILFSKHVCFLIKYTSDQYLINILFLVFMILSALLIWCLSTETLGFKLNSNIQGFANKVRQSYRGEFNFV